MLAMLVFLIVAFGAMFWLSSRQRKKQMEAMEFRNRLAPGQEVMTIDRMYATVVDVDEETNVVVLESMPGVQMRFSREAIASLITPDEPELDEDVEPLDGDMVVPDDASSLIQEDIEDTTREEWLAEADETDETDRDSAQDQDNKEK